MKLRREDQARDKNRRAAGLEVNQTEPPGNSWQRADTWAGAGEAREWKDQGTVAPEKTLPL